MRTWASAAAAGCLAIVLGTAGAGTDHASSTADDQVALSNRMPVPTSPEVIMARYDAFLAARNRITAPSLSYDEANDVIEQTCMRCHSDRMQRGNLSLANFDAEQAWTAPTVAEAIIRKLRAGMMPPPGSRRPEDAVLQGLAATLEAQLDSFAIENPNPGVRTFQRLNQAEYRNTVRDLLALEVDPEAYLPPDTKSANFDNIADVQMLSPTLMDAYLNAAAEVARIAVGDARAVPEDATYTVPRLASQWDWVPGAPFGTRGGVSVVHNFVADGDYALSIRMQPIPTGQLFGSKARDEVVEISVDGKRVALVPINRGMSQSDPTGMEIKVEDRVHLRAGPHRVSAAFLPRFEGPVQDVLSPVGHSLADTQIGASYGVTALPHLRDLVISGPFDVTGVSDTRSRERIFSCRPTAPSEELPCAEEILTRLATRAYRRALEEDEVRDLVGFYQEGAAEGGFEAGIRTGLQAMLASPWFIFRIERVENEPDEDGLVRLSDSDLASRLSYFLWGSAPDAELVELAREEKLSDPDVLREQVTRMLAAPAAEQLGARFASQWLRLQDIEKVHPDALTYPDYDQQLSDFMVEETERFFNYIVAEDRSVLELITADWTFLNERLAAHYEIPGVAGPEFRRVAYPGTRRRGILGQGSVLTLTSHANRTSPVLRGKWVMEVLLGTPPPPPPPDVPELESTEAAVDGRFLTVREQMEIHRADPSCNSCHVFIDPIGLALENFDVVGKWRTRDSGNPVDASGELYDGTPLNGPDDLRAALMARPEPFLRNFTENLMAYSLGRRVEYYDQPTVRQIVERARARDLSMSEFILGIVESPAFQMRNVEPTDRDQLQQEN